MSNPNEVSLFDRLGGIYSIAAVVDDFVERIMVDPRLNANPLVDEAHHKVPKPGFKYLVTGDYLKSGLPYNYFKLAFGKNNSNYLKRDSLNEGISYEYTAVKAPNGEIVVAPNCLQCHAQIFDNKLIIGLGNSTVDFTGGEKMNPRNAAIAENLLL